MNSDSKGLVVFCQAPADVQFVLSFYEQYSQKFQITLVVINLEGIYHYFQSLNLKFERIILIPYPENIPLKNLKKLLNIKAWLNYSFNSYFSDTKGYSVYFFSKYFDWLTAFYISRLSTNNNVYLVDHISKTFSGKREVNGLLIQYRKLIYWILTSVKFRFFKMQSVLMMEFPVEYFRITAVDMIPDKMVYSKYCVRTETMGKKSLLLFESKQTAYDFYISYRETIISILTIFKEKGYSVYIKPHPRQGYSEFLEPYIEKILPAEVPAEFLSADDFSLIAGVDSNAVAYFAKTNKEKTVSLLKLFTFKRDEERERFIMTQTELSDSKINFISSLSDLQ